MHFNKAKKVALTLLINAPMTVFASNWPIDESVLLAELKSSYKALNEKADFCHALEQREVANINVDWLAELSTEKQEIVLLVVNFMVSDKCIEPESIAYSTAVMNYTSETNNRTYLDEWLLLNKKGYSQEFLKLIEDVPVDKVLSLTTLPQLSYPFDHRQATKVITGGKNKH